MFCALLGPWGLRMSHQPLSVRPWGCHLHETEAAGAGPAVPEVAAAPEGPRGWPRCCLPRLAMQPFLFRVSIFPELYLCRKGTGLRTLGHRHLPGLRRNPLSCPLSGMEEKDPFSDACPEAPPPLDFFFSASHFLDGGGKRHSEPSQISSHLLCWPQVLSVSFRAMLSNSKAKGCVLPL